MNIDIVTPRHGFCMLSVYSLWFSQRFSRRILSAVRAPFLVLSAVRVRVSVISAVGVRLHSAASSINTSPILACLIRSSSASQEGVSFRTQLSPVPSKKDALSQRSFGNSHSRSWRVSLRRSSGGSRTRAWRMPSRRKDASAPPWLPCPSSFPGP